MTAQLRETTIQVVFFASVREALGTSSLEHEVSGLTSITDLIGVLRQRGDVWHEALGAENLLVAVNQTMVDPSHKIEAGDEVAFFPPVTGG